MGNPYTAPTLANYNATPPDDDGTEIESNVVKWSNHIDKIGDPLKTYAQAISANVSTAFGLVLGNTVATKSTNYTVAASDRGNILEVDTGGVTVTLLAASSAGDGFPLVIVNNSTGLVTIDGDSSETINGSTTVVLYPTQAAVITCNGSAWLGAITGRTDVLPDVGGGASFTSNTTLANISLALPVEAGQNYQADGEFFYTQDGGDIKFQLVFSETPADSLWRYQVEDETGTEARGITNNASGGPPETSITTMVDTDEAFVRWSCHFNTHASNAGTVVLQAAQVVSDVDATTIRAGSLLNLRKNY